MYIIIVINNTKFYFDTIPNEAVGIQSIDKLSSPVFVVTEN